MIDSWQRLKTRLLVGTYSRNTASEGIYLVDGQGSAQLVAKADNPSYLLHHPSRDFVYCVNETSDFSESSTGALSAFKKSDLREDGFYLDLLNQQPSLGADPCHLTMDSKGEYLVVSNYSGGTFATFGIKPEGYIEAFQSVTRHEGQGPVNERQESVHVHSSLIVGKHLFIADLGADRISRYKVSNQGEISGTQTHIVARPGAGPRFLATNDKLLFVLNELDNTLASYNLKNLTLQQCISTVPDDETPSIAAHLTISRDSKFLYLSNRGFDTIAVVKIEPELEIIQTIDTGGAHPRHFCLTPDEDFLIVANQDSNNLVAFSREQTSGCLSPVGLEVSVPCPTYLLPV